MMGNHDGFWMWGFNGIFMILFWILVILAVAALIRWLALPPGTPSSRAEGEPKEEGGSHALDILEERYARGEIDREEFLRKREDLRG
jgi:putative membrane protein